MTRERGSHTESKNCKILLFPTLTGVLTRKSNAPLGGPHFGSNSPLYGAWRESNARGGGDGLFWNWLVHNVYSTTTNVKMRSYPDTLISESMVSFADSPFKFLLLPPSCILDPWRYCIQCVQNGEYSGGTESFVGISCQKQHLRPLCGMICKCELYCLSKRSRHFIDQQVITFHTFRDLISLHRKNTFCSISQNYNFNEWGTRFQFVYSKFSSFFTEIWLEFCLIMWQKMVLGNCYSWRPSKVMSI